LTVILRLIDRRDAERRNMEERLFEQHKQLYLMIRRLGEEVTGIKEEIKKYRKKQENDLSSQVFDVCYRFLSFLFDDMLLIMFQTEYF